MTYTTLTERRLTTARAVAHSAARRIVASLTLTDPERAAAVGAALLRGGVTTVEVPLAALPGATRVEGLSVAAGNVRSPRDAELALEGGAAFATSPTLDLEVVRACRTLGLPFLPGVATPNEVQRAVAAGVRAVLVFPAPLLGGAARVAALADAFPDVDFIPAGAIAPEHLRAYPKRATVVSSALVRPADPRVEAAARRALRLAA
ncbi:MAG TPA: hypothetical protein VNS09_05235 [Solirubrobacter sp.]|nr:hypothetical protein [Solirubrobacter sp.]